MNGPSLSRSYKSHGGRYVSLSSGGHTRHKITLPPSSSLLLFFFVAIAVDNRGQRRRQCKFSLSRSAKCRKSFSSQSMRGGMVRAFRGKIFRTRCTRATCQIDHFFTQAGEQGGEGERDRQKRAFDLPELGSKPPCTTTAFIDLSPTLLTLRFRSSRFLLISLTSSHFPYLRQK